MTVAISGLTIANGRAQGGAGAERNRAGGSGGAAGMGGAIFVNSGNLTVSDVVFDANQAQGGSGSGAGRSGFGGAGGGGVGANAGGTLIAGGVGGGGGALGGTGGAGGAAGILLPQGSDGGPGAAGGEGAGGGGGGIGDDCSDFPNCTGPGADGGKGGDGGFGGGGGGGGASGGDESGGIARGGTGGNGGFGGGGGGRGSNQGFTAVPGGGAGGAFGGSGDGSSGVSGGRGGGGAGLGGAIFVRAGSLTVVDSSFANNSAAGGTAGAGAGNGQGKGGALFILSPAATLNLSGCVTFSGNTATNAAGSGNDTQDRYGPAASAPAPCDSTAPVITPAVSGTLGDNGWYTSDVTVSFTVVDGESSVTTSGCGPATVSADGTQSFTCTATSEGGEASATVEVKRDATAPSLAPVVSPQPVLQGGPASVVPNATDATSGVADASCGPISTTVVGSFDVDCTATDLAGNRATVTVAYAVQDSTAPVVTPVVTGTVGGNGWYTSDVSVSFTVVDGESSVTTSGCDPVTVTTDGTRSFTCTATSEGGEATATVEVKRDATAPVLAPVVTPLPVLQGFPASVAPNAGDATFGLADASCGTVSTAAVGSFQVVCTATDVAGNQATVTVAYQVEPALVCDSLIGTRAQLEALGYNVIVGDDAGNILVGTSGPDLILGLGGIDVILAGGGDDVVCGGAGNDIVFLGNGDDRALGDGGVDVIDGGGGNDTIDGGLNDDIVTGGEGDDVLVGGAGRDRLSGNRGNDTLDGAEDTDRCDGGPGTDSAQRCEAVIGIP